MLKLFNRLLFGLWLICLIPPFSILLTIAISSILNCEVHEGFANDCFFFGINIGEFLYLLGGLGWLTIISAPFLIILSILLGAIATWKWWRKHKARDFGDDLN